MDAADLFGGLLFIYLIGGGLGVLYVRFF